MKFKELQARLADPDPWVRVEALRILAMVEETRAMPDIERVFKTDPEPGVRQVAQWAGRIVYQAVKRANDPGQSAADSQERDSLIDLHEAALIHSLLDKDRNISEVTQLQLLQYELTRGARGKTTVDTVPDPTIVEKKPEEQSALSSGLLEAGLSPDLLEYFLKE